MDRKSRSSRLHEDMNEEVNLWKQICYSLAKLEGLQKDEEVVINTINKFHYSLEKGISSAIHQKLKESYKRGIELSNHESKLVRDIIEKLTVLIALKDTSEQDQKRKKRKTEGADSRFNGSAHAIFTKGTTVAAKQPDKNDEWILAVVIQYYPDRNKYQVEDVDQDEYGGKQHYMLSPKYVIPVPTPKEAEMAPEIPAHQEVLALYPSTTCFYRAVVISPPSKNKDIKNYKVQFEDDNDEVKQVAPEHVLEMPKTL
ncbi:hypothetical protein CU097_009405 [Rhizopus azygosporus]|uniref:SGF29 C-terminal domain-containing protein n=1 Tax=Rhizopus azygosporus TaxID=86630 RepID=A0A367JDR5_RHIAZ|nr:hypothetical protein CU097_009405 [Rhizopus azygosporus]CEG63324.1 hypothetical protein RMATCC62417_00487 [Rhizopus microsporus]